MGLFATWSTEPKGGLGAANPVVGTYSLHVSRYLRQLPSPSSPNSSLWRHALRNFLTITTLPVTSTVDVDASRSNLNTLRGCRNRGKKSRCGNDGECTHAH